MSFQYRYRKQIIIISIILIVISISIFLYLSQKDEKSKEPVEVIEDKKTSKLEKKEEKKDKKKELMVDVKGEVNNVGIYTLSEGSRVIDAINMAGGTTENADTSVLNLSKKLEDEMVIIVYSHYQVREFESTKEKEKQVLESCKNYNGEIINGACIATDSQTSVGKVSINTGTIEQLMMLPGIGEEKAKSIIEYREKNGLFTNIDDIKNVTGIGEALFDKIKESITV